MRPGIAFAIGCCAMFTSAAGISAAEGPAGKLADPADPQAVVPALTYESAFSGYLPFREQKSDAWKQANRQVAAHPGMSSMDSMKEMTDQAMPGMESKSADEPMSKQGDEEMANAQAQTAPAQSDVIPGAGITGTGIVQGIDKTNGKLKLTHDPIAALGWPKMTMFFRLKDRALADQVREGDKVEFSLEQAASGYVISALRKSTSGHDTKHTK